MRTSSVNSLNTRRSIYGGWKPLAAEENKICIYFISFMAQQPIAGQGLLIIEASRSHSDTPYSVGLLWTSDQPDTQHSQTSMSLVTFEPTDPCLRLLGYWDRHIQFTFDTFFRTAYSFRDKQTWRYGYISEVSEQVTNNNGQQIEDTHHATRKTILGLECVEIQFDLPLDVHAPWK